MSSIAKVKERILQTDLTCYAQLRDGSEYQSHKRGIAPIIDQMEIDGEFFRQAFVADKVIGKAAALLLVRAGISGLYTKIISDHAVAVMEEHRIPVEYGKKVPYIVNRAGDGMCPMEESVLEINDPEKAFPVLKEKLAALRSGQ